MRNSTRLLLPTAFTFSVFALSLMAAPAYACGPEDDQTGCGGPPPVVTPPPVTPPGTTPTTPTGGGAYVRTEQQAYGVCCLDPETDTPRFTVAWLQDPKRAENQCLDRWEMEILDTCDVRELGRLSRAAS